MFSAAFSLSSLLLFSVLALWCFASCCAPCIPASSSSSSSCCAFCFRFDLLLGWLWFSSAFLLQRSKGHALQQVPRKGECERSRRRGLQWSQGVKGHLLVSSRCAVTFWSSSCDRWHTSACTCMHRHAHTHTAASGRNVLCWPFLPAHAADVAVAVDVGFAGLMKPIDTQTQQQQQEKQFQNRQLYAKRERERVGSETSTVEERERQRKSEPRQEESAA